MTVIRMLKIEGGTVVNVIIADEENPIEGYVACPGKEPETFTHIGATDNGDGTYTAPKYPDEE